MNSKANEIKLLLDKTAAELKKFSESDDPSEKDKANEAAIRYGELFVRLFECLVGEESRIEAAQELNSAFDAEVPAHLSAVAAKIAMPRIIDAAFHALSQSTADPAAMETFLNAQMLAKSYITRSEPMSTEYFAKLAAHPDPEQARTLASCTHYFVEEAAKPGFHANPSQLFINCLLLNAKLGTDETDPSLCKALGKAWLQSGASQIDNIREGFEKMSGRNRRETFSWSALHLLQSGCAHEICAQKIASCAGVILKDEPDPLRSFSKALSCIEPTEHNKAILDQALALLPNSLSPRHKSGLAA